MSIAVAFLIGAIEFIGVLSTKLHLRGWLEARWATSLAPSEPAQ